MTETLNGFIERVTYHNPENGYAVLRVKVKGREDLVTLTGNTTSVTAGEHVEASGRWVIDRQFGQQFKADKLKTTHPASAEGIEKYLASGAIRSIGPKIAARIVAVHHERTLERIAKWGDGWMPNAYPPDQSALDAFAQLRRLTEQAGRDPARVGVEVWVSMGSGSEADWAKEARFWKQAGASHLCLTTTFDRRHHKRIPGHTMSDHLAALRRYHGAVAEVL